MTNTLITVTGPAAEPVTTAEAKLWCKVDDDADDALIADLIAMAREHVEGQTNRRLVSQSLKAYYSDWPCEDFILPVGPVSAITHVKYYDTDDTVATLASTYYDFDGSHNPPFIRKRYLKTWPSTTLRPLNAIEVQFVAGYSEAATVPLRLKNAVLGLIATWYRQRSTVTIGNSAVEAKLIPQHFQAFLESMRIYS